MAVIWLCFGYLDRAHDPDSLLPPVPPSSFPRRRESTQRIVSKPKSIKGGIVQKAIPDSTAMADIRACRLGDVLLATSIRVAAAPRSQEAWGRLIRKRTGRWPL
jgi:hypothetical protein